MPYGEDHLPVEAIYCFGHHDKLPIIYVLERHGDEYEIVSSMELADAIKMHEALADVIDIVSRRHMFQA